MPEPLPLPRWRLLSPRTRVWLLLPAVLIGLWVGWLMVQPKLQLMGARATRGEAPVPIGLPTPAHRQAIQAQAQASAAAAARAQAERCRQAEASAHAALAAGGASAAPPAPPPGCVGGPMPVRVLPAR